MYSHCVIGAIWKDQGRNFPIMPLHVFVSSTDGSHLPLKMEM
jgi:hypothetical protein